MANFGAIKIRHFYFIFINEGVAKGANLLGNLHMLRVRTAKKAVYMMRGPFKSVEGFAPACSTLRCHLAPR